MTMVSMWAVLFREFVLANCAAVVLRLAQLHEQFRSKARFQEAAVVVKSALQFRISVETFFHALFRASLGFWRLLIGQSSRDGLWLRIKEAPVLDVSRLETIFPLAFVFFVNAPRVLRSLLLADYLVVLPVIVALVLAYCRPLLRSAFGFLHVGSFYSTMRPVYT